MDSFLRDWTELIKSRVRLFTLLTITLFFGGSLISYVFYPADFRPGEIPIMILVLVSSGVVLLLNQKTKTMRAAKLIAMLFTVFLLINITKLHIIYSNYIEIGPALYLFMLFFVSFTIPWTPLDLVPITFIHMAAYSILLFHMEKYMPEIMGAVKSPQMLFDGIIFLLLGFILCAVIRKKDLTREIQNYVLLKENEMKNIQMQKELQLANRVHNTLIPKSISMDKADIAVTYIPMNYIGGDYAKFHLIDNDKLVFIICDVTGHGVSAALLVNRLHTEFERLAQEHKEPGVLLKEMNDFIVKSFEGTDMFLSAFCCLLDFGKKTLSYSNYGHPPQYIYRISDSDIARLEPQATLMGIMIEDKDKIHELKVNFEPKDKILLFTDGVNETMNKGREEFGIARLEGFIRDNHRTGALLFNQKLISQLKDFSGGNFQDDILLISINIK
ncbi:MAG: PP2C family protein-serine/threonine phosphatase [bacterium]|nr:PP2C family protein-serine/threonine phosphatase [bacterium]